MITITILGIDPYLGRQLSRELTGKLAEIYDVDNEKIFFNVPESFFLWNGVEQNSWNILVRVNAPSRYEDCQDDVAMILGEYMKNVAIHSSVEFYYYREENRYEFVDDSHPKFMTEKNVVYDDGFEEEDEYDEGENSEEPYLGNIFKDVDL